MFYDVFLLSSIGRREIRQLGWPEPDIKIRKGKIKYCAAKKYGDVKCAPLGKTNIIGNR